MPIVHHHQLFHFVNLPTYPSSSSTTHPSPLLSFPSKPRSFQILCCVSIKHSNDPHLTQQSDQPAAANLRLILAAGGTAGHITPAIAIAEELKISDPTIEILFVGASNGMESTSIPSAGYPFASIPPVKLYRPRFSLRNLSLPFHLLQSIIHSFKILQDFEPNLIIGTGGYVSFPTCLAALLRGVKIVIQEQNSVPGTANYILSFFAQVIFVAYNSTVDCFQKKHKCVMGGNPVRLSLRRYVSKAVARNDFFPRSRAKGQDGEEALVILVLGGSFGANAVNIALLNLYSHMLMEHKNWNIIWQTGVEAYDEMESLVKNHPRLVFTPFLHSMDMAYAAADLVVSRAGAMTCSEILTTGKPAILIPSPNVDEGHQLQNASLMADIAGSRVITEDELDSTTLRTAIVETLEDETIMAEMSERALKAAKPDAAAEIARYILSSVDSSAVKK